MKVLLFYCCLLLAAGPATVCAQSAADAATLSDLRIAARQMQLEAEGVPSFRLEATLAMFDFLGRPEANGHWEEEFSRPSYLRRTFQDGATAEKYAPEDQANIGVPIAPGGSTFLQRLLVDATLHPGPTEAMINGSKQSFKVQKVGEVSLRCVTLEPLKDVKNSYSRRMRSRTYCLSMDSPAIRLARVGYGMIVTYNSLARFGGQTFAQQVTMQERGHDRGRLHIVKLVAAPELLKAELPKLDETPNLDTGDSGAAKLAPGIVAGSLLSQVAPVYPLDSKQRHISGTVLLHAVINKEGTIESLEVVSAPADDLAEAAVEAVSQWRYKPYLLNGKPTEVDTIVSVNFSFG